MFRSEVCKMMTDARLRIEIGRIILRIWFGLLHTDTESGDKHPFCLHQNRQMPNSSTNSKSRSYIFRGLQLFRALLMVVSEANELPRPDLKENPSLSAYWSNPWTRRLLEAGDNDDSKVCGSPSEATKSSS